VNEIAAKANGGISWPGPEARQWAAGLALVVIADLLFWPHEPGIALSIFYLAIAAAILLLRGRKALTRPVIFATSVALAGALPLIETPSWTGFLSATFGITILALAAQNRLPRHITDLPAVLVRFGVLTPVRFATDALNGVSRGLERGFGRNVAIGILKWIVPLALAGIFVLLFSAANPLIESALQAVNLDALLSLFEPLRVILWGLAIAFAWPFLRPKLLRWRKAVEVQGPQLPRAESIVFGRGAILRSLLVFNAIFAIQTLLDLTYLWGGLALPEGMTYASYAHRGAYPLIVTALLAAGFVLAALRPGGAAEQSPLIRRLVYLFIAQNVLLVVSSILRLDLYVEVYSLTELRVAAGIWMGLVAVGLVLILARIALRKSNKWLVATNLASLGLTLYACSFVDLQALIARFNVEHSQDLTGQGAPLDTAYLWQLGPAVIPALDDLLARGGDIPRDQQEVFAAIRHEFAARFAARSRDWRSWTLRDWRLEQYLAGAPFQDPPDLDTTATMPPEERPDSATMP
jgi:hypothetical protein